MKLDWSKILILAMVLFIVFIVAMGIKMATSSQSLYEQDYYEKGEDHTSRMNMEKVGEHVNMKFASESNTIHFEFDSIGLVEEIRLVNLADSKRDKTLKVEQNDMPTQKNESTFNLGDLGQGIWVIEVKGSVNSTPFFIKKQIVK